MAAARVTVKTEDGYRVTATAGNHRITLDEKVDAGGTDAGPGAKVKLGPPLNGLDGRQAGTIPGFNYSEANKSSGIKWDDAQFAEYIKNPMQRIPGTRMAFAGIRNDKDIANLWTYLKQFDASGNKR